MKPPLMLIATDLSHILEGEVSISHCLKLLKPHDDSSPQASGLAAYWLRTAGIKLLSQIQVGCWSLVNHSFKFNP